MAKDAEWRKLLERSLWASAYMNAAEMRRYYESEFGKLKNVPEELGLTKQ